jgi:Yip1 domain
MTVVERIKGICLKPGLEWSRIETEPLTTRELLVGYVAPLAAIGPLAQFVGGVVLGRSLSFAGTYRIPLVTGIGLAVLAYVMSIIGTLGVSWIINALAPSFGGLKNRRQALRVAVFAYTPTWIAGVFMLFMPLGPLIIVASFYGLYLLYLGLPVLMKSPREKAGSYTAVVVVCAVALWVAAGALAGMMGGVVAGRGLAGRPRLDQPWAGTPAHVQFDKDSALGRLQAMGEAMASGRHVDPVGIEVLKPFVPDSFAGMPKTGGRAEKHGLAGFAVSKAEATYGDRAEKHATLEISDAGGASALLGMASWINLQGEREDDQGFERTRRVDGRLVHEQGSKQPGGSSEFTVVLGDRFVVSAKGRGVELADLQSAVSGLPLGKLEALKEAGVQK